MFTGSRKETLIWVKTLIATPLHRMVRRFSLCSDAAYSQTIDMVQSIAWPSRETRLIVAWRLAAAAGGCWVTSRNTQ